MTGKGRSCDWKVCHVTGKGRSCDWKACHVTGNRKSCDCKVCHVTERGGHVTRWCVMHLGRGHVIEARVAAKNIVSGFQLGSIEREGEGHKEAFVSSGFIYLSSPQ